MPGLRLSVSVFVPPMNVGVAPITGPVVPFRTVTLCASGALLVNAILTVPAFAVSDVLVNFSAPPGFAASASVPVAAALPCVEPPEGVELAGDGEVGGLAVDLLLDPPHAATAHVRSAMLRASAGSRVIWILSWQVFGSALLLKDACGIDLLPWGSEYGLPGKASASGDVLADVNPWFSDLFLASQSDARLVALARGGHERAFTTIVHRYRTELYAAAGRLDSTGRAEDLVQQALLQAFASLRSGTEVRHLRGWLHQILRNVVVRERRERVLPADGGSATAESAADAAERRMLTRASLAAIAALPSRQRAAIVQSAIEGRGRAEVAASIGVSEGAVRQLVHRARETLRASVTAVVPLPLARSLATTGHATAGASTSDVALSTGTISAAGAGAKLGALLASGVAAIGVVSTVPHTSPRRNGVRREARASRYTVIGQAAAPHRLHAVELRSGPRSPGSRSAAMRSMMSSATTSAPIPSRRRSDRHLRGPRPSSGTPTDRGDGDGRSLTQPSRSGSEGGQSPRSGSGDEDGGRRVAVVATTGGPTSGGGKDETPTMAHRGDGSGSGSGGGPSGGATGGGPSGGATGGADGGGAGGGADSISGSTQDRVANAP